MTTVTAKRQMSFYIWIIICFLFLNALGTVTILASTDILQGTPVKIGIYFLLVLGIVFWVLSFFMIYAFWKQSPKVVIDRYVILIGRQSFYLKDIQDIILTGKMPFRFIINFPMEGMVLIFNDGTEKFLFDNVYSNIHEIKVFLKQEVLNKQEYYNPILAPKINEKHTNFKNEEIFKGNQFVNFRSIIWGSLVCLTSFAVFYRWESVKIGGFIFWGAVLIVGFLFNSLMMNYFILTTEHLIIKNHYFIWKTIFFRLSDIEEIVFETQPKQSYSMRIITSNFKSKLYPASTLTDKTWLTLKQKLEEKGIIVRNECVYEEEE